MSATCDCDARPPRLLVRPGGDLDWPRSTRKRSGTSRLWCGSTQRSAGNEAPAVEYLRRAGGAGIPSSLRQGVRPAQPGGTAEGLRSERPSSSWATRRGTRHPPPGRSTVVLGGPGRRVHLRPGAVDDKDNVVASLMTCCCSSGRTCPWTATSSSWPRPARRATPRWESLHGREHWPAIEAEFCLAEGGGVDRRNGRTGA